MVQNVGGSLDANLKAAKLGVHLISNLLKYQQVEDETANSGGNSEVTNTARLYSSSTSYMLSNTTPGPNYY